ncbi:MAG: hypothetical protein FD131_1881 [Rhodocyclaceae bacterium]|nr:MAG: hypothetical protein FD131_1881 [Rhodocyclaceae bacterium]
MQGGRALFRAYFTLFRVGLEEAANVVTATGPRGIMDRPVETQYLGKHREGETGSEKQGEQALHAGIRKWLIWRLLPLAYRTALICASFSFC